MKPGADAVIFQLPERRPMIEKRPRVVGRRGERRGRRARVLGDDRGALDGLSVVVLDRAADAAGLRRGRQRAHDERRHEGDRRQQLLAASRIALSSVSLLMSATSRHYVGL